MRDYITTIFNLIVGLVDPEKILMLALIGCGIVIIWQSIGLFVNFHATLARKCRKISKFLSTNGLSAQNYNNFLALVAKMPQEFIRGYKTFEHASYGLPSDYIKRFESVDVETNGGMFNHGKSILKAFIYAYTFILSLLGIALIGSEQITGANLAEALLVPILFLIIAKVIYYIFVAIRQQQYRIAVDEFNEMLDIMNEKIENNDNLPGPDVLALAEEELARENSKHYQTEEYPLYVDKITENNAYQENAQDDSVITEQEIENYIEEIKDQPQTAPKEEKVAKLEKEKVETVKVETTKTAPKKKTVTAKKVEEKPAEKVETKTESKTKQKNHKPIQDKKVRLKKEDNEDMENESKRGRGRPKKIPEGELVITNDKEFEEALSRAEKLMRKSEEALSSSQAKRVEKAIKELVDAMNAYKENK